MLTPRPYISFSQLTTFEMNPERYVEQYFRGKASPSSVNMSYGSLLAEGLERGEATGDPLLDLMAARIPKLDRMDLPVEDANGVVVTDPHDGKEWRVPVLMDGKERIPLLAKPDTAAEGYGAFKEYKTSVKPWTQKKADDSGQITFYATAMWLVTKKVPADIELVCLVTEKDSSWRLRPTGDLLILPTKRTLVDVLKMTKRIKEAWAGIKLLSERELL